MNGLIRIATAEAPDRKKIGNREGSCVRGAATAVWSVWRVVAQPGGVYRENSERGAKQTNHDLLAPRIMPGVTPGRAQRPLMIGRTY